MILLDVNVLVYAFRIEPPRGRDYLVWLEGVLNGQTAYGISDNVLSGFMRIVPHPRAFLRPDPIGKALAFAVMVREQPHCVHVQPGVRHWAIFADLCRRVHAKGNIIPDAYFAALAIETGSEWITADRGFARFPDLQWRHPLD